MTTLLLEVTEFT